MSLGKEIVFTIHDEIHTVKIDDIDPNTTLNTYLRDHLGLKGTKGMCYEGGCGACCVVIKRTHPVTNRVKYELINSCLMLIYACQGYSITTIEHLKDKSGTTPDYHVLQKKLADGHGTQCGYCSPGMVMNMYSMTMENDYLTPQAIESNFSGNLCRCTGYRPILEAFKSVEFDKCSRKNLPDIEDSVCPKTGRSCAGKCDKSEWDVIHGDEENMICVQYENARWYKVYKMNDLLRLFNTNFTYQLCSGNTGRGIFKKFDPPEIYVDITSLSDIYGHKLNTHLFIGAGTVLAEVCELFLKIFIDNPNFAYLKTLYDHIQVVANVPVRNLGSIGGNLMLKYFHNEFPSDIFTILETIGATVIIVDQYGHELEKTLPEFLAFSMKKCVLKTIKLPPLNKDVYKIATYKVSPRKINAHAYVNAGFLAKFSGKTVTNMRIVYGGIQPKFIHASATEKYLVGKNLFNNSTIQGALEKLKTELVPDHVLPDASPDFRKNLAMSLFYKFVLKEAPVDMLTPKNVSGGSRLERPLSSGTQEYETKSEMYPVTEPINKLEAYNQAAGKLTYINDMTPVVGELHGAVVLADCKPFSKIQVDSSAAMIKGVVAFISHRDVVGDNAWSPAHLSPTREQLFCEDTVLYNGQLIGVIVAETPELARKAATLVKITYTPQTSGDGPLFTIKEVLDSNQKSKRVSQVVNEKATRKGTDVKHNIKGTYEAKGQYHFSMETQTTFCMPNDEGGLDVYPATQWIDHVQGCISNALKIKMNKINIFVKRLGGAYGCKIVRASQIATACAVASWTLNKPVRIILPLTENMKMVGKRNPFFATYDCDFNDEGVIQRLDIQFYHDYGTAGVNEPVHMFTHDTIKGCYVSDTYSISGFAVQTDMPGNAYCRAPGSVEGTGYIEAVMEHIAKVVKKDPVDVRLANIDPNNKFIKSFFTELMDWVDYPKVKNEIKEFNENNRWKKKGMSLVCMEYSIFVFGPFFSTVTVYAKDGSVCIIHGGIENGQGIHTKVAQVCAYKFKIGVDKIEVKGANNWSCANNIMTGGSLTSEACCHATMQACDEILERLKPVRDQMPGASWEQLVLAGFAGNIQMTSTKMYSKATPGILDYKVNGVCWCLVEIDGLTGERVIQKVNIIEDVAQSMNPSIDWGQVEGAFTMGVGAFLMEDLKYDSNGGLVTNNTWHYKIPGASDIPVETHIRFKKNTSNPNGVLNSKAIGEPPQCLSCAVPFAIRNCVESLRIDSDPNAYPWFDIDGPTTVEQTHMKSLIDYKQFKL